MLSLYRTLTVQSLIDLTTLLIPKLLNPKGRHRGSGRGPIGSNFLRHGAKIRIKTQSERTKTTKQKPRADCKLAQKTKYRIKIYMMHEQV